MEAHAKFAASATGNRALTIQKGGAGPASDDQTRQQNVLAGTPAILHTSRIIEGVKGTAITVWAYQNTGGGLNVTSASAAVAYLGAAE